MFSNHPYWLMSILIFYNINYVVFLFTRLNLSQYFLICSRIIQSCHGFFNTHVRCIILFLPSLSSFIEKPLTSICDFVNISSNFIKSKSLSITTTELTVYVFFGSHSRCASNNLFGEIVFNALHSKLCIFIQSFQVFAIIF